MMKTHNTKIVTPPDHVGYRVLLADDHPIVRIGLKEIIGRIDKNIQLEETAGGEAVVARLKARPYDLVILDINLKRTESFSLTSYLRREFPSVKLLLYTDINELILAGRFLRAGVSGYLSKQADEKEIVTALDEVRSGRRYLNSSLCLQLSGHGPAPMQTTPFDSLTDREFEVALQILHGNSSHDIARILHLNRSTVATHKFRIMKKLKLNNEIELLRMAKEYDIF